LSNNDEERINNLVAEARMLEGTFNELSGRQNLLERILIEGRASLDTIKGLGSATPDEVLIPVGGGILLRSEPPKVEKVLVNIGANVVIEKSRDDATKLIEERVQQIEQDIVAVANQRNQVARRLDADRRALQSLINRQGQQ
jgi:prefoldin alpha subunit